MKYISLTIIIVFSTFWILLYPGYNFLRWENLEFFATKNSLTQAKIIINKYVEENKITPVNTMLIRSYAKSKKMRFSPYDNLGQRLEYVRLSDRHFILRSFGQDGIQNTNEKNIDQITGVLIKRPELAYKSAQNSDDFISSFDALSLVGAVSPDRKWYAQTYLDRANANKQLTIRSKKIHARYMIAPHDSIEEFFWLSDSKRIVYTVTNSELYADGIYIWNIEKDEIDTVFNTLGDMKQRSLDWQNNQKSLIITLAKHIPENETIYLYIVPHNFEEPISVNNFLNDNNLYTIQLNSKSKQLKKFSFKEDSPYIKSAYWALNKNYSFIGKNGTPSQREWRSLPFRGDFESVIKNWEKYAKKNINSPIFAYSSWVIILLYNDTLRVLEANYPEQSKVIRGIASETAKGLAQNNFAPSYLRSLAHQAYFDFLEGRLMDTKVSLVDSSKSNN